MVRRQSISRSSTDLRSLLDLEDVPAGTYNSANITVGTVTIQYLDTTQSPPALTTIDATVSPMTVTEALKTPLVLNDNDLVGFFMDLDLRQSIQTDSNGNVTGNFTPTFDVKGLSVDDADAQIDCFYAGVVSVNPAGNQFVIQGPRGRQYTVDTDSSTNFDSNEMPLSFDTNTIVEVSGTLNRVTRDIDASEVEVVSTRSLLHRRSRYVRSIVQRPRQRNQSLRSRRASRSRRRFLSARSTRFRLREMRST